MNTIVYAVIEKYGYLKSPQFWVNVKNDQGGSSRIGPFKSLKQCGVFLRSYPKEMPVIFEHLLGWDNNEKMIRETTNGYNFKFFGE